MATAGDPDSSRLKHSELSAWLSSIFESNGCSRAVAGILADNCASAERDGAVSHGLYRMAAYVDNLRRGWVDGHASPKVEDVAPGFIRIDARNGFAQPASLAGRPLLVSKARDGGVAVAAIRGSHHFGALALDLEPIAKEGLVALSVINCERAVVAHGAKRPIFGTNPLAFAAPNGTEVPFIIDLATAAMASGEVAMAQRNGLDLPAGTGVDAHGELTSDPREIIDGGALLTFGGHKGSSISLMIEILCAGVVGGSFSFEVEPSGRTGVRIPCTGQTIIVMNPEQGLSGGRFAGRVNQLLSEVKAAGQARLPGDKRVAARAAATEQGILVTGEMRRELEQMTAAPKNRAIA